MRQISLDNVHIYMSDFVESYIFSPKRKKFQQLTQISMNHIRQTIKKTTTQCRGSVFSFTKFFSKCFKLCLACRIQCRQNFYTVFTISEVFAVFKHLSHNLFCNRCPATIFNKCYCAVSVATLCKVIYKLSHKRENI